MILSSSSLSIMSRNHRVLAVVSSSSELMIQRMSLSTLRPSPTTTTGTVGRRFFCKSNAINGVINQSQNMLRSTSSCIQQPTRMLFSTSSSEDKQDDEASTPTSTQPPPNINNKTIFPWRHTTEPLPRVNTRNSRK